MKKLIKIILISLILCLGFICTSCDAVLIDTTPYPSYPYPYHPYYVHPVPLPHNTYHYRQPMNINRPMQHNNSGSNRGNNRR